MGVVLVESVPVESMHEVAVAPDAVPGRLGKYPTPHTVQVWEGEPTKFGV